MKRVLTILIFLAALSLHAQKSSIVGQIIDENGGAFPFASVVIEGTSIGTISDNQGNYTLQGLEAGTYTVEFSYLGYEPQFHQVSLRANETYTLNISFVPLDKNLQEVEIIGRKARSYKNDDSYAATKTATRIKDIPQAISYVTKEIFEDQQAYRVNDVVKNISGVNQYSWYDDFSMRGFRSGDTYINGLRVIGLFGPQPLLANIERVEVLKGPASAMFGNASPGGTMNRVTKKPLPEHRKSVNFTTGSFNTLRSTLDFTGPMNDSKSLLYRINIAYENSGSFRDLQETKTFLIAPSISFLPTKKTSVNFDLVLQNFDGKLDRGQPIYGATAGTNLEDPSNTPINFAIGATNDYHRSNVNYFTISLNHKLSNSLSFNSSYMKYINDEDLFEHRTSNRFAIDSSGNQIPTLMGMRISARQQKKIADNVNNYLVFNTQTGPIDHKILVGFDYVAQTRPIGGAAIWTGSNDYLKKNGTVGKYKPSLKDQFQLDKNGNPIPNIPHFNLKNPNYTLAYPNDYILRSRAYSALKYYTYGFYIQDQIKFNKLQVLLGLRYNDYFDVAGYKTENEKGIKQNKFIPRLGLVYGVTNDINLYATYTESFEPQNPARLGDEVGGPFKPLQGNMIEAGLKAEFFNNRLAFNLAGYTIKQLNELILDPNDSKRYLQIGETSSNGIELDVTGRITPNFSMVANYAFNISKFVSTPADSDFKEGDIRQNAPKHQGGLFVKYGITEGFLSGISLNASTNFVSERNSTDGPELKFPSYTVFDAGISYSVKKFVIRATVNNVFNKKHWVGGYNYVRMFPGAPRNYLLSVGYTF